MKFLLAEAGYANRRRRVAIVGYGIREHQYGQSISLTSFARIVNAEGGIEEVDLPSSSSGSEPWLRVIGGLPDDWTLADLAKPEEPA